MAALLVPAPLRARESLQVQISLLIRVLSVSPHGWGVRADKVLTPGEKKSHTLKRSSAAVAVCSSFLACRRRRVRHILISAGINARAALAAGLGRRSAGRIAVSAAGRPQVGAARQQGEHK